MEVQDGCGRRARGRRRAAPEDGLPGDGPCALTPWACGRAGYRWRDAHPLLGEAHRRPGLRAPRGVARAGDRLRAAFRWGVGERRRDRRARRRATSRWPAASATTGGAPGCASGCARRASASTCFALVPGLRTPRRVRDRRRVAASRTSSSTPRTSTRSSRGGRPDRRGGRGVRRAVLRAEPADRPGAARRGLRARERALELGKSRRRRPQPAPGALVRPGARRRRGRARAARGAFLVKCNRAEARLLTGERGPRARPRTACWRAAREHVVVTLGARRRAAARRRACGSTCPACRRGPSTRRAPGDAVTGVLLARLGAADFYPPCSRPPCPRRWRPGRGRRSAGARWHDARVGAAHGPARAGGPRLRLREVYGIPTMAPHGDPLAELVLTVLSQSTNDRNRDVAFLRLRERFASWEAGARRAGRRGRGGDPPRRHLEGQVRAHPGDPAGRSATRSTSGGWRRRRSPSARPPVRAARASAARPPPACCCSPTACATCRSTPTSRAWGRGWGCCGPRRPFDELHDAMLALTPPGAELELHVNLLRHGRRTCVAQRPALRRVRAAAHVPEGGRRGAVPALSSSPTWRSRARRTCGRPRARRLPAGDRRGARPGRDRGPTRAWGRRLVDGPAWAGTPRAGGRTPSGWRPRW